MHVNRRSAIVISIITTSCLVESPLASSATFTDSDRTADSTLEFLQNYFEKPSIIGQGKYSVWGFDIYRARLWAEADSFQPEKWHQNRFALELTYLRDAEGKFIAKKSMEEMTKQNEISSVKIQAWNKVLENLFPDIKKNQSLTGVYTPNSEAKFFHGKNLIGEIRDPELLKSFFEIWFSSRTSAPELRKKLFSESS